MPSDTAPNPTDADETARKAAYLEDFSVSVALDLAEDARAFGRLLLDRARDSERPDEVVKLAAAFDRISRAARRAVLLARFVFASQAKPAAAPASAPVAERPSARPPERPAGAGADRLESIERPDSIADEVAAIAGNPVAVTVAAIEAELQATREELAKPLVKPSGPIRRHRVALDPKPWQHPSDEDDDDQDELDQDEDDDEDEFD